MSKLEKFRIGAWTSLVVFSMGWGVAAGASFFGGVGVSPSVALFGVLGNLALVVTLIVMHKEHPTSTTPTMNLEEQ